MSANLEVIALMIYSWQVQVESSEDDIIYLTNIEQKVFLYGPLSFLLINLVLNIYVSYSYHKALSKKPSNENIETTPRIITASRLIFLILSYLITFHNTSWLNIRA